MSRGPYPECSQTCAIMALTGQDRSLIQAMVTLRHLQRAGHAIGTGVLLECDMRRKAYEDALTDAIRAAAGRRQEGAT